MNTIELHRLSAMPDHEFVSSAWAAFDPQSAADGELESRIRAALQAGTNPKVLVLRIWSVVKARTGRGGDVRLQGGTLAAAANLAQRIAGGLPVLSAAFAAADFLLGKQARRRARRYQETIKRQEGLLEDLAARLYDVQDRLVEDLAARLHDVERAGSEVTRRVQTVEGLGDDLTRRVDMMTFEARQALESAALSIEDRDALMARIEAGTKQSA